MSTGGHYRAEGPGRRRLRGPDGFRHHPAHRPRRPAGQSIRPSEMGRERVERRLGSSLPDARYLIRRQAHVGTTGQPVEQFGGLLGYLLESERETGVQYVRLYFP
jgi:hypothetical protein